MVIGDPLLAGSAAVASHFVLDVIPHHNLADDSLGSAQFRSLLAADGAACLIFVGILTAWQPAHWFQACICAFLATSPDLMWVNRYLRARRHQQKALRPNLIMRFHEWLQWFQRPIGGYVEAAWFGAMVWLLYGVGR
jgi:hypothetical protein